MLKKLPPGRDVDDDDVFEFNDAFTDPRAKVHINSIQVKETVRTSSPQAPFVLLGLTDLSRRSKKRRARRRPSKATASTTSTRPSCAS